MSRTVDPWKKKANMLLLSRLDETISVCYRHGLYPEAARAAEKACKIAGETYGPDHRSAAVYANNAARMRKAQAQSCLPSGQDQKEASREPGGGKRRLRPAFGVAAVLALALFVTAGFAQRANVPAETAQPVYAAASDVEELNMPFYHIEADFDPASQLVEGEEEVIFMCREPVEEVKFNLYMNRYQDSSLDSSEVRRYAMRNGQDTGYIEIEDVTYNGETVYFEVKGETLRVAPGSGGFLRGEHALMIKFRVKIPNIADRVGGTKEGIWLGNWLPVLSADNRENRPTEIGDPFVNMSSTYEFRFSVPEDFNLVLSNTNNVQQKAGRKIYTGVLERVRDLPVFLNRGYRKAVAKEGETEVNYYYYSSDSRPEEVLAAARKALAFFNENVGQYPWQQLNIVENDMFLNGMEYSTMILISKGTSRGNLSNTVFHEVAHQWFYNIVGSDQYNAPYIDEGLVEFFTSYAQSGRVPGYTGEAGGLYRSLDSFGSWQDYRNVHYRNGRKLFEQLYVILGKNEFENFIKEYYDRYKFGFVSATEFRMILDGKLREEQVRKLLD